MKYPTFVKNSSGELKAFLKPNIMFHLDTGEWGKGSGFQFRIYKTRATCRRHETTFGEITYDEFVWHFKNTMGEYLIDLTSYLPQELMGLNSNDQKLL